MNGQNRKLIRKPNTSEMMFNFLKDHKNCLIYALKEQASLQIKSYNIQIRKILWNRPQDISGNKLSPIFLSFFFFFVCKLQNGGDDGHLRLWWEKGEAFHQISNQVASTLVFFSLLISFCWKQMKRNGTEVFGEIGLQRLRGPSLTFLEVKQAQVGAVVVAR